MTPYEELSTRAIRWGVVALLAGAVALAVVLLLIFEPEQREATKTTGTIALGTGGAVAL